MLRRLPSRSGGSRHLGRWWMTRFLAATASAPYDRRRVELSLPLPTLCALLVGLGEPCRPPQLLTFPVASWCHVEASTPRHRSFLRTRRHVGPMVDTTSHLARAAPVTRPLGQRNAHNPERLWLARLHLAGGVDRECTTNRHTPHGWNTSFETVLRTRPVKVMGSGEPLSRVTFDAETPLAPWE
jgi:hypothetical protein